MKCQRWLYTADEYEIRGNLQTLYLKNTKRIYTLDEYALREGEDGQEAIVCVNENAAEDNETLSNIVYIYSAAWIISITSLAIAFVLCIAVPGLTTYRAVMPCFVASLLVSYIILVVRGLGPLPSSLMCYSYGVGLQFSFLAAFFWLNVIAFDLWRSISTPVISPGPLRLLAYMTYGWGCPLLFVGTAVAFDKIKDLQIASTFRPRFEQECWFHGTEARFAFFYGPISAILIINLIFFILTLFAIRSKVVAQEVEKHHSLWRLSIELAVIMGLCWIMEVVSWAVGGDASYWYATDIINALQGLLVLIIIARRPNVTTWVKQSLGGRSNDVDEGSTFSYVQQEKK
uniref:G-protein coupled receptors family 2 profile 2 domain-containing protein n=1 Tax=Strigamia maritima TaxID=126957 RepID=T1ILQ9_STRMM